MNKLIYDIGMHIGQDTKYYLELGYNVISIEANPLLVEAAEIKFKDYINCKKLVILNIGISNKNEILPFYRNLDKSEWSSFDKAIGTRNNSNYEVIDIDCITTESLFEKYGVPYYLKVDIEGYDYFCLNDISFKNKPKYVSCEASDITWFDILHEKGYTKFKLLSQGDNFTPINISKEGSFLYPYYLLIKNGIKKRLQKYLNLKFDFGASGPFGEETSGNWISHKEARQLFEQFSIGKNGKPLNNISWFDIHATY